MENGVMNVETKDPEPVHQEIEVPPPQPMINDSPVKPEARHTPEPEQPVSPPQEQTPEAPEPTPEPVQQPAAQPKVSMKLKKYMHWQVNFSTLSAPCLI